MKIKTVSFLTLVFVLFNLLFPSFTYGATPNPTPWSMTECEKLWCDPSPGFAGCNGTKIRTAIGCIPVLGNNGSYDFLNFVLQWAFGIGGGIAFLLIVYSGFMTMTSQGNPERLQAGKELLTSAITGIVLLIFSVFILKLIGVDILGLGQFGFGSQ